MAISTQQEEGIRRRTFRWATAAVFSAASIGLCFACHAKTRMLEHNGELETRRAAQNSGLDDDTTDMMLFSRRLDLEADETNVLEFASKSQDNATLGSTTSSGTVSNETQTSAPIIAGLSAATISDIQEEGSAQYIAYQWLLADPNLNTFDQRALRSRFAMATLYHATRGDTWTLNNNWLSYNHSVCQWYSSLDDERIPFIFPGFESPCYDRDSDYLQNLVLADQNMKGTLPEEISLMTGLSSIFLNNNSLAGSVPFSWVNLSSLIHLSLNNNHLQGTIHSDLFSLTNLQRLDLSFNAIQGTLPTEIGRAEKLVALVLEAHQLVSPLPSELGSATNLQYLNMGNGHRIEFRKATSKTPQRLFTEIGRLTKLRTFLVPYTYMFERGLPEELFDLTSLNWLDLKGAGALNSELPTSIGRLTNLVSLELTHNSFIGNIPSELALLTNLADFNAEFCDFTGTIPSEVATMTNLRKFLLCYNLLSGSIPEQLGSLTALDDLHLCRNDFTGHIATTLGLLTELTHLDLKGNFLSGQVPPALGQLNTSEAVLEIQGNELTGVVPPGVCDAFSRIFADCVSEIECGCCTSFEMLPMIVACGGQ